MIYETFKPGAMEQATRRFATPDSITQKFLMGFIPAKKRKDRRNHLAYSLDKAMRYASTPYQVIDNRAKYG